MNVFLYAQSSYEVSLYGKIDFCKIAMGEKIVISPTKAGEMFFEPLKYDQEDFNENSLVTSLLSNKSINIEDAIWKKDVTLAKNIPCKIRFLEAGYEVINKKEVVLYRLDIKLLDNINCLENEIDKKKLSPGKQKQYKRKFCFFNIVKPVSFVSEPVGN